MVRICLARIPRILLCPIVDLTTPSSLVKLAQICICKLPDHKVHLIGVSAKGEGML
jgi:hypothetical protein